MEEQTEKTSDSNSLEYVQNGNDAIKEKSSDVIIRNETILDIESFIDYNKYTNKKLILFFCLVFPLIIILWGIIDMAFLGKDIGTGIGTIIGGIIVAFLFPYLFKKQGAKKKNIPDFVTNGTKSIYEFYEDKIVIREYLAEKETAFTNIFYNNIRKVGITKNYVYIYISNMQAFILRNDGFTIGNKDDILKLMTSKNLKCKITK